MKKYNTVAETFLYNDDHGKEVIFIDENENEKRLRYSELKNEAKKFAVYFSEKGITKGDRAILAIKDESLFLKAFWGMIIGGIIPIPVIPPYGCEFIKGKHETFRFENIVDISDPTAIICGIAESESISSLGFDVPVVLVDGHEKSTESEYILPELNNEDTMLILFTSVKHL